MRTPRWEMLILLPVMCWLVAQPVTAKPRLQADPVRLQAHVEFLASDLFNGRDTGSKEYELAARYVAAEFQKLGLKPGGDDGTFLQSVPVVESRLVPESVMASIHLGDKTVVLEYPDEFTASSGMQAGEESVTGETVFVGYGIVAPNRGHDDYAGLDVTGKIVVLLTDRPESWPSEEGAHYGSGRQKARFAAERGAVGIVVIHTPREEKTSPYRDDLKYLTVPRMKFIGTDGEPDGIWPGLRRTVYVDSEPAKLLFTGAQQSLDEIFEADLNGGDVSGFSLASDCASASSVGSSAAKTTSVVDISSSKVSRDFIPHTSRCESLHQLLGLCRNREKSSAIR